MQVYILKRCVQMIPVLLGVTFIVFFLLHLLPGNPAQLVLGPDASAAQVEELERELGLHQPLYIQYGRYLSRLLRVDLGESVRFDRPVGELIKEKIPSTLELTLASMIVIVIISFPIGISCAVKRDSLYDHVGMAAAIAGISIANFWMGIMLIMLFAGILGVLPSGGRIGSSVEVHRITGLYLLDYALKGDFNGLLDSVKHLLLPALTLGLGFSAISVRIVRTSMLEVLGREYIVTARAKGLGEQTVIYLHGLKNALIPIITVLGLQLGILLGGVIVVETVFSWPGLGSLLIIGIGARDYMLVQGTVLIFALARLFINLLTDVSYALVDPRIKYH